jgi:hypothetical protein
MAKADAGAEELAEVNSVIALPGNGLGARIDSMAAATELHTSSLVRTGKSARRWPVAYFERVRDTIAAPFSDDLIRWRTAVGWQMVSIEWRRELPDGEAPAEGAFDEEIPYGLRISEDCKRLEADPREHQVLMEMMEWLAQDFSYSAIVSALNEKGYRMRDCRPWSRIAVFKMIPRLIEVGPRFFSSEEWQKRWTRLEHAKPREQV